MQYVLAHILPEVLVGDGTSIVFDACEASSNPVVDGCDPSPVNAAGQIVMGQLFLIVNVADSPPESTQFEACFICYIYNLTC